jgi:hypothetical protein
MWRWSWGFQLLIIMMFVTIHRIVSMVLNIRWSYSRNRPLRPIGLWDVEDPKLSRESVQAWWWDCQSYAPDLFYLPGIFLILSSVRGRVNVRAIVRLEGINKLKKFKDLFGNRKDIKYIMYYFVIIIICFTYIRESWHWLLRQAAVARSL